MAGSQSDVSDPLWRAAACYLYSAGKIVLATGSISPAVAPYAGRVELVYLGTAALVAFLNQPQSSGKLNRVRGPPLAS
jgi:hypothetical protein